MLYTYYFLPLSCWGEGWEALVEKSSWWILTVPVSAPALTAVFLASFPALFGSWGVTVLPTSRQKPWSRRGGVGAEGMDRAQGGGQKASWG